MSSSEQLRNGGADVVFYAPLYVWNGAAIMVHGDRGIRPAGSLAELPATDRSARVRAAMEQLRGKRIGITTGTTFEQTVLDALRAAGMQPGDVHLINARPEDNLAAFLAGDLDAFSGGLTERVQARRQGAMELVVGPDVSVPALDGIIARRDFAEAHPHEMQTLVDLWFETIRYMRVDVRGRSELPRSYLRGRASVDYTAEEYAIAWTFDYFPADRDTAARSFLSPQNIYYWRPIWQSNSNALIAQRRITGPVPESSFWGGRTLEPQH
jgi:ABC-type nitrate/sulfonate/bicarbonate transport system substrate-binding protein